MAENGHTSFITEADSLAWSQFMEEDDGMLPNFIRIDSAEIVYEDENRGPSFIGSKYLKGDLLGDGSYSKVKEVLDVETLCRRAIKIVKLRKIRKIPNGFANVKREIKILKRLKHSNVINLIEEFSNDDKQKLYMVLEYCCCNLQSMLDAAVNKTFREWQAHYYFTQLIAGLEYLHSKGIIHKDIKPGNLLLTIDQVLKITDLGVSEELDHFAKDDTITTSQGSPVFQAPEIADGAESFSGFKIDIWSCGITLYRMCADKYPFDGESIYQLYDNIAKADFTIPDHFSQRLKTLIKGLLHRDSESRYSIPAIKMDMWFKEQAAIDGEPAPMPAPAGNPAFSISVMPNLKMLVGGDDGASIPSNDVMADCEHSLPATSNNINTNSATDEGSQGCIGAAENYHIAAREIQTHGKKHKKKSKARCAVC